MGNSEIILTIHAALFLGYQKTWLFGQVGVKNQIYANKHPGQTDALTKKHFSQYPLSGAA